MCRERDVGYIAGIPTCRERDVGHIAGIPMGRERDVGHIKGIPTCRERDVGHIEGIPIRRERDVGHIEGMSLCFYHCCCVETKRIKPHPRPLSKGRGGKSKRRGILGDVSADIIRKEIDANLLAGLVR